MTKERRIPTPFERLEELIAILENFKTALKLFETLPEEDKQKYITEHGDLNSQMLDISSDMRRSIESAT